MATTWQDKAAAFQSALHAKIPQDWRLPEAVLANKPRNVLPLFATCGVLSPRELEITTLPDATALLKKIHARAYTSEEVALAFCKRAAVAHQLVNCLMDVDFERGLQRARELDAHLTRTGQVVGPLHGLPVSIKDLTQVVGLKLCLGIVALADDTADADAVVVQTLRQAGAVLYVKTTMPQTGMALETTSHLYGRTTNPANTNLVAGGSSGGECALGACRGAAMGVATDIGGSIRAPAAFNGLYGIRPSSRRFSYLGNNRGFTGQMAILSSIGPVGCSLRDIALMLSVWSAWQPWRVDPVVVPMPWTPVADVPSKVTIGVMMWDGVVMPHPPVQRAMREAVAKLKAAGHEVIDVSPFKQDYAWDLTFRLYYPTGGRDQVALLAKTGEPAIPAVAKYLEKATTPTANEQLDLNRQQRQYQIDYLAHWNQTASKTTSGQPVDALLTPAMGSAAYPHDVLPWWGYMAQWNLLDYPSVILPTTVVGQEDVADAAYVPVGKRDAENWALYDPALFEGAPVSLQLVGRHLCEERLLAVAGVVDGVIGK